MVTAHAGQGLLWLISCRLKDFSTASSLTLGHMQCLPFQIWNHETWQCVVHKQLMDQTWSVALHPCGTSMVVGMTDKLRVFMILKDDILEAATLSIRKCDVISYSHGGKYFAAVNPRTNNIQVGIRRLSHQTPCPPPPPPPNLPGRPVRRFPCRPVRSGGKRG